MLFIAYLLLMFLGLIGAVIWSWIFFWGLFSLGIMFFLSEISVSPLILTDL